MTKQNSACSTDNAAPFEAHKKSSFTAYATFLISGVLGGHRYYLGYGATAFLQTLLGLTLIASSVVLWPYLLDFLTHPEVSIVVDDETTTWLFTAIATFVLLGIWLVSDMFRIQNLTHKQNKD